MSLSLGLELSESLFGPTVRAQWIRVQAKLEDASRLEGLQVSDLKPHKPRKLSRACWRRRQVFSDVIWRVSDNKVKHLDESPYNYCQDPEWGIAYSKNTPSSSATRLESVHWGDWEGDVETCIKSNTWPRLVLPV